MAEVIILESLLLWTAVIFARAQIAQKMGISPWYAFTTPLGAALFAAMMLTSTVRVMSGKGVQWKGRRYTPK
jgi:hypothetical protein